MDDKPLLKLPVRSFVEFVMRSGDLSGGFRRTTSALDGIKFHQALQRERREECVGYLAEVPVSWLVEHEEFDLELGGRIDGVLEDGNGGVTIEEIKTTAATLPAKEEDTSPMHWAQAQCYAFIYAQERELPAVGIKITYVNVDTKEVVSFDRTFTIDELKSFFTSLVDRYRAWARTLREWAECRDGSIRALGFPFPGYRRGQRELAVTVFTTIRDRGKLFAQAPTGIGKTMATLFPAIKSMGEGHTSKVFYLTAKTVTRSLAEGALDRLRSSGLKVKSVTITAKEKVCFQPGAECDPKECPFAKGYYDRLNDGIADIFHVDAFTRSSIEEYARKHTLCPFEFSLDLSLWCDCIVCDYNYVFDPRVYLRRFFAEDGTEFMAGEYTFLVDEAHNLVDRSREMFSAELLKSQVHALKKKMGTSKKKVSARLRKLYEATAKLEGWFTKAGKLCTVPVEQAKAEYCLSNEPPYDLSPLLRGFAAVAEKLLAAEEGEPLPFRKDLLEFYFEVRAFLRTAEYFGEMYVSYYEKTDDDVRVKLFCVDPSRLLQEVLKRGNASVFFSATLTPLEYFVQVLGGDEDSATLKLASPFPRENLLVLLNDAISTRYRDRQFTYDEIVRAVSAVIGGKTGNYLIFFPSYRYMNEIADRFRQSHPGVEMICQHEGMSEPEREEFLQRFSTWGGTHLVGFAVMGGVFGEGIDLVGERLSGVVIVGVGLPQISFERDVIRAYYDKTSESGFPFAYIYPGMNKVLQAVGRVIRTETDRGVVLLIDERFSWSPYRNLLPREWQPIRKIAAAPGETVKGIVEQFWNRKPVSRGPSKL